MRADPRLPRGQPEVGGAVSPRYRVPRPTRGVRTPTGASERRRSDRLFVPPWSATAGGASPVECDRRGNRVRKEPSYVRSRHRRCRAHADRARVQGIAQGLPGRRAGRRAAQGARGAQPRGRLRPDRRRDDGRGVELRRAGVQRGAQRDARGRPRPSRARVHGQSLLRLVAADAAHGLPRDHGRRGRPVHRRRRGVRLARRPRRGHGRRVQERQAGRLGGLALRRLHPDGTDRRERRRSLQGDPRAAGRVGRDLPEPRRRRGPERPLRSRDRPGHARRRHGGQPRRRPAAGHHDGGPGQPQARLPARRHRHGRQLVPAQRRRGRRARHERRARQGARPHAAGADRRLDASPPSARRSWASARSPPSRRCSSRPG